MATIMIESFDHYNTATQMSVKPNWNVITSLGLGSGGGPQIYFPAGRVGGNCLGIEPGATTSGDNRLAVIKTLPSTYTTIVVGFAVYWGGDFHSVGENFMIQTATGARVLSLQFTGLMAGTNANLQILNAAGTVVATTSTVFVKGQWYYVEVKCPVSATALVYLKVNGVVDASVNGITVNTGTTAIRQVQFQSQAYATSGFNQNLNLYIDDVYSVDTSGAAPRNDFLGDCRVECIYPIADGFHHDWTPDSGTVHYSRVNETPPDGDASYVYDATPGDIDTYVMHALASTVGQVFGVQTNLYVRKDDAAVRQIAQVIRKAGTDYVGVTSPGVTTSYLYYTQLYDQDPSATDWTLASVVACEYGIKEIV